MVLKVYEMYVLMLILFICMASITSFDVSWIPTDPDGPLPLSSNYRAALAKLCTMIESGQTLPNEIKSKLPVLKKMCIKLNESSSYSSISSWLPWGKLQSLTSSSSINNIILTLVVAGGGSYVWINRKPIYRYLQSQYRAIQQQSLSSSRSNNAGSSSGSSSTRKRSNSSGGSSSNAKVDMAAIREARVRQYANLNTNQQQQQQNDSSKSDIVESNDINTTTNTTSTLSRNNIGNNIQEDDDKDDKNS